MTHVVDLVKMGQLMEELAQESATLADSSISMTQRRVLTE